MLNYLEVIIVTNSGTGKRQVVLIISAINVFSTTKENPVLLDIIYFLDSELVTAIPIVSEFSVQHILLDGKYVV